MRPIVDIDDDVNLYAYVGNDPLNASDPSGTVCVKGVNYGSPMCVRSRLYESIDGDSRVSNRTRFFAAAAMVTSALATPFASSGFMGDLSARLQQANIARADAIREGRLYTSGSERENTNDFIHFEQSFVQGALDKLKADDSAAYDKLIGEANDNLNGRLTGLAGLADPNFAKGLAAAKEQLGGSIDFANQGHREILGRAIANVAREAASVCTYTPTGSHIARRC